MSDTVSTTDALRAFKMCDRIYFIGNEEVSVHLLDTVQGLVLIDTGYPNMYTIIVENIKNLGFEPKNISAIFHTHGHIDHYGCTRELVALSGAKTYIGRIDNDIVNKGCQYAQFIHCLFLLSLRLPPGNGCRNQRPARKTE